ncbi:MAG TPA: universal stress protein [Chloroflexota bacterium]|jgi:nucleotide-binding universal stress UspA family protein|nr:universal stress protein [Chloroflexota bacterium]
MFNTILVPLDGSELAERALPYARLLANPTIGQIILVRAATAHAGLLGSELEAEAHAVGEAEAYLHKMASGSADAAPTIQTDVYYGTAAEGIRDEAGLRRAGAIVMSTHGRSGLSRLVYGSVAEHVLREMHLPVLLLPPRCERSWPVPNPRIVLPLDGSRVAEAAIEPAVALARQLNASILVLSSAQPAVNLGYPDPALSELPDAYELAESETREYLAAAQRQLQPRGVAVSTMLRVGNPATAIVEAAADPGTAAVVMTTHGRTGLARLVLGSVAEEVVRHAETPVLVVPAFSHERARALAAQPRLATAM